MVLVHISEGDKMCEEIKVKINLDVEIGVGYGNLNLEEIGKILKSNKYHDPLD